MTPAISGIQERFQMKILIIEDDTGLNRGISFALEQEGYETASAHTLREGGSPVRVRKPQF